MTDYSLPQLKDKTIVVWFSCGAASAVAAYETIRLYGKNNKILIVNNPIAEEHEDNQRFLKDVEAWLNHPISFATNPEYPDCSCQTVWEEKKFMGGISGSPCTVTLKKEARIHWEKSNPHDYIVLGFTVEEKQRHDRFWWDRPDILPILINGEITKQDCWDFLRFQGLKLPAMYDLGYPNTNCIGCIKASSPTYWNHVREVHPEVFEKRAKLSREIGARLVRVKGERIFLDELDPKAKGRPMKNMQVECSSFCSLGEEED